LPPAKAGATNSYLYSNYKNKKAGGAILICIPASLRSRIIIRIKRERHSAYLREES